MSLAVLPAVHFEDDAFPDYPAGGTPGEALTALARAHGEVYVVDTLGVRRNQPSIDFLAKATRLRSLWVDAGSRYAEDAMDVLVAGARRVTLRWTHLKHRAELETLADLADAGSVYVGLEFGPRGFVPNASDRAATPETVARAARDLGLGVVVLSSRFDSAVASRLGGLEAEKWWVGPLGREDALALQRLAFAGVAVPAGSIGALGSFEPPKADVAAKSEEVDRP